MFESQSHFISMIPIVRKGIKIDYKLMRSISVKNEPLLSKERIVRHPRHHELNFMKYTTVKRSRIPRKLENLLTNKVCTSTLFSRTRVRRAARQ